MARGGVPRGLSRRRRITNRAFTLSLWIAGFLAMLPLLFIAGFVVTKGVRALNVDFFTKEPVAPGQSGGGIVQSFIGSGLIVGMATPTSDLGLVYVPEDRTVEVRLSALPRAPSISWLNPRTGVSYNIVAQAPQHEMDSLGGKVNALVIANGFFGRQTFLVACQRTFQRRLERAVHPQG